MKNVWIVYNAFLTLDKMVKLIERLEAEFSKRDGFNVYKVKNNEFFIEIKEDTLELNVRAGIPKPDIVIFWDKDIMQAKLLEELGISVYNTAQCINECDDKRDMHIRLEKAGVLTPKTVIAPKFYKQQCTDVNYFNRVIESLGFPVIVKEARGSFGMQVYKCSNMNELVNTTGGLTSRDYILQEAISSTFGEDIRVNVVGDKVIGSMLRMNPNDFRANISNGGNGAPYEINEEQAELAIKASKALGCHYSGVDLLVDEDGKTFVCEVNSNPNFLSFEAITGIDYCNRIIDYIIERECD